MGHQGRFGKYGDIKRVARLRKSRTTQSLSLKTGSKPLKHLPSLTKKGYSSARLHLRSGRASDAHFITRLCEKVFSIYGPYGAMISRWHRLKTTTTIVALIGPKPMGFAMIGTTCDQNGMDNIQEILAIAVDPEKQRLGIGNALIHEIERKAITMKSQGLYLHTALDNETAQRLFIKNGYHPSELKRLFYPAGQDAVFMLKIF